MIEVQGLRRTYARGRILAIRDVSFAVARGEVFGLIGPDGAGKTSLIQILAGILRPDAGQARVAGVDVIRDPEHVKTTIGYMPQGLGLNLYDSLTVEENIEFFRDLRRVPTASYRDNRQRLLEMTRLGPFLDRAAGKLSGGMRQKLALICTLIHLPDVLLLDEPTTGVDPISRRDFWKIIHTLVTTRAVTVLLTTSYMDEAERCHRVSLLHEGAVIASGPPEALAASLAGRVFAVRIAHPDEFLDALPRLPAVQTATIAGGEVRVLVRDTREDLAASLAAAGLSEVALKPIAATLEDVFVHHLTGGPRRFGPLSSVLLGREGPGRDGGVAADHLTCRFGPFTAVAEVSLQVSAGEIVGLLGPNGAGKTTFIRMLCGLQRPTAGTATVAGYDVQRARDELRGHIGYMSQRFSLYQDQSVLENLNLSAGLYGLRGAVRRRRVDAVLASLGLDVLTDRLPKALPLGVRQRLALACAILHEPGVLFLDEPTAGVDPLARRQFWDLVHLLAHQYRVAVLVSTHYMDEATHCDRLGFMHDGRLIAVGTPIALARRAEADGGPMITVETTDFARAFLVLQERVPGAMLYGRRIRWQSRRPEAEAPQAREWLAAAGLDASVEAQPLSMEDTFVSVLRAAGLSHG